MELKKTIKSVFSENIFSRESAFRVAYFVCIFLSCVTFLDIFATVVATGLLIWSTFVFHDSIKSKTKNLKSSKIILLFLFFSVVTECVNIKMGFPIGFFAGLVMIYHAAICFFIFYGMYVDADFESTKKEMFFLCKMTVILSTFFVCLSFLFLLFKDSVSVELSFPIIDDYDHYERIIGIVKKPNSTRFTGVFINPNILAFVSVISMIFLHILYDANQFLCKTRKWTRRLILAFIMLIHFVALILSDSIASFLLLVIYAVLWLFYKMVLEQRELSLKNVTKRSLLFLLSGLVIILGFFTVRAYFQNGASNLIENVYSMIAETTSRADIDENIHFGRPNHDLRDGSGRSRLLKQAAYIFMRHPILGIGNANAVVYGEKYFDTGIAFSNFHNGYVSILVCNGLIGFVLFAEFLLPILLNLLRLFLKNCLSQKKYSFVSLLVFILSYLVFALFEKTMLSEINFMGVIFWAALGYAVTYLQNEISENLRPER